MQVKLIYKKHTAFPTLARLINEREKKKLNNCNCICAMKCFYAYSAKIDSHNLIWLMKSWLIKL